MVESVLADSRIVQTLGSLSRSAHEIDKEGTASGVTVVVCTYNRAASLRRFLDSLAAQDRKADQLIVVDASPNRQTEEMFRSYLDAERLASQVLYLRVSDALRGLTRQRNFALQFIPTDLVGFFDDDAELMPDCLQEMERVHRLSNNHVAGVAARILNQSGRPTLRWRILLFLRAISELRPGRYDPSGVVIPWGLLAPTDGVVEGDYVSGGAMMWKTSIVRRYRFDESLQGYAYGEDLDLSLRARGAGRLLLVGKAHVLHWLDPAARPNPYKLGYMQITNGFVIHRRAFPDLRPYDLVRFAYVWFVDTLLLLRYVVHPQRSGWMLRHLAGRLCAAFDLMVPHRSRADDAAARHEF